MFEIGTSLRETRVRQQLELSEVELATKIRARYLRALEEENFEALPAQTYVKGFLRTYADYLGLDGQLYVDEFNSRYGEDEVPREPVVPRRSSYSSRQHRRVERRWVLFALAGIGALLAFFVAAWKFGGNSSEQIPNLGTTTTNAPAHHRAKKQAAPPAKPKPATFTLYMRSLHGNSWMEVRNGSVNGRPLFTGTVELGGQGYRYVKQRLWINFGAPWNLGIVYNGHLVSIRRAGPVVFTPRGFSRAA